MYGYQMGAVCSAVLRKVFMQRLNAIVLIYYYIFCDVMEELIFIVSAQ